MKKNILKKSFATMMIATMSLGVVLMPLKALAEESTDTENVVEEIIMIENADVNLEETIIIENEEMNLEETTIIDNADVNIENTELATFDASGSGGSDSNVPYRTDATLAEIANYLNGFPTDIRDNDMFRPANYDNLLEQWKQETAQVIASTSMTSTEKETYRVNLLATLRQADLLWTLNGIWFEWPPLTDESLYTSESWTVYITARENIMNMIANIFNAPLLHPADADIAELTLWESIEALVLADTNTQTSPAPEDKNNTQTTDADKQATNNTSTTPTFGKASNTPAPQTGDTSSIMMYSVLLALSVITSTFVIARKVKKH